MSNEKKKIVQSIFREQSADYYEDPYLELVKRMHIDPHIDNIYTVPGYYDPEKRPIGVTKKEATDEIGTLLGKDVDERTVWNMIQRLQSTDNPYCVAGQPVHVEVREKRIDNKRLKKLYPDLPVDRSVHYCTENSCHPIFMQLNMMQVYSLFLALAHEYFDRQNNFVLSLGLYIYEQLSTYATERLELLAQKNNQEEINQFIDYLSGLPEDRVRTGFLNEKAMGEMDDLSENDYSLLNEKLRY